MANKESNGASEPRALFDIEIDDKPLGITIGGAFYALRLNESYAVVVGAQQKAAAITERAKELADPTEQQEAEFHAEIRQLAASMLDAPAEILDQLSDMQLMSVALAFTSEANKRLDPTGGVLSRLSPASIGSTEGASPTG